MQNDKAPQIAGLCCKYMNCIKGIVSIYDTAIALIALHKFFLIGKRAFTGNLLKEFMEAGKIIKAAFIT